MDYQQLYSKPEEVIIKQGSASCFGNENNINGNLVLTNYRIYLQVNDEYKMNETLLSDINKITVGGINVLRCELKNGQRFNFLVTNVLSWLKHAKKALKNAKSL